MSDSFIPVIKNKVDILNRKGEVFNFHLRDLEFVRPNGFVNQVVAHLAITAPEHIKNPKEEITAYPMELFYKPDLHKNGFDYEGFTGRAYANYLFIDRYKQPEITKYGQHLAALVAVGQFHYVNGEYNYFKNPEPTASASDFALQISGMNGTKYLGIRPEIKSQ